MTKTKLLASAGFGLLIAFAAPAQASGPWTGVYLGGHAGGIWGDVASSKTGEAGGGLAFDTSPVGTPLAFGPDGVVGGAQVGYLYQFSDFVVGIDHALVDTVPLDGSYATSEDHEGWTAGAGFEQMLAGGVSLALEYDYYDFGSVDHVATQAGASVTRSFDPELHTVTARLNWHFNP
jgi:opacity protein-like surface antigen